MTTIHEISVANWEPYRGNNHEPMLISCVRFGGAVHFGSYIGERLSQKLWEDLVYRLMIKGLCIYGSNDAQWTLGWGSGHCSIMLDDEDRVVDIRYVP